MRRMGECQKLFAAKIFRTGGILQPVCILLTQVAYACLLGISTIGLVLPHVIWSRGFQEGAAVFLLGEKTLKELNFARRLLPGSGQPLVALWVGLAPGTAIPVRNVDVCTQGHFPERGR